MKVNRVHVRCLWLLAASILVVASGNGCAAYPPGAFTSSKPGPVASATAIPEPTNRQTTVYYGTDRGATGSPDPYKAFNAIRADLTLGSCVVAIPWDHEAGVLETHPWWRVWQRRDDPSKEVTLLSVTPMSREQFAEQLRNRVAGSQRRSVLIFIHGYNVTFSDAVRRTAQLAFDLDFDGAPIAYSWPSNGELLSYESDAANADWTGRHLHEFLSLIAAQSGAADASLIVHSMGNRALAAALNDLAQNPTIGEMKLQEIVLAAPDLDRATFEDQIAPAFARIESRVTLYASSHDEALGASERIAGYPRVDDTAGGILIAPGIESVDASLAAHSILGHSYFGDSTSVLRDIHEVIAHAKPEERSWLTATLTPHKDTYWQFAPK
jgi:esterase/lipase superfamily enzyme